MKLLRIVLVLAIIGTLGFILMQEPSVDPTGKVHVGHYQEASATEQMNLVALPFRGKQIEGKTVGSSTGIHVEWSAPSRQYNHFVVTITNPTTTESYSESGEQQRFSLDFLDLEPETEYIIALQACIDPDCDKWYVAENELATSTYAQHWQIDEEGYAPTDADTISDPVMTINGVIVGELPENATTFQNVFVEGVSYDQRMLILDQNNVLLATATLLNP